MFARALSLELQRKGWRSILCFQAAPAGRVRSFLAGPNTTIVDCPALFSGPRGASARAFAGLMRQYRPAVAHLHYMSFVSPYPWLARMLGARRIFFTDQQSRPEGHVMRRRTWWKRAATLAANFPVTRVVAVADYGLRLQLASGSLPGSRHTKIYNSVDLDRVTPSAEAGAAFRERFGIAAEHTLVTQVSWLIPEKGIADLIEIARRVAATGASIHFAVVGKGSGEARYRLAAADAGVAERVTFTGEIEDPMKEGVFDATDILCHPCQWEEAFGWVIAEAMAFGNPVVASRAGAIPELVEDGVTGFVVDRHDGDGFANRLLHLAAHPELRGRMGAAGRRAVEEKFDLKRNIARHMELYGIARAALPESGTSHAS